MTPPEWITWTPPEWITWITVGLAESVAIVALNLCTIIVFTRNRNLRKRSTYLVINLAVIDILVGGVAVFFLFYWLGVFCNVWRGHLNGHLKDYIETRLPAVFPGMSLLNITIIALERAYATFRPFKHRVLKKRVYGLLIVFIWVSTALSTSLNFKYPEGVVDLYFKSAFSLFVLLIICVSYSSIVIKVRFGAHPQHHGAASRERKLTVTLLIVTVASLLVLLPANTFIFLLARVKMPFPVAANLYFALHVLAYANSLVNPILYAIRMPEYRSTLAALFRKKSTLRNRERRVVDLPLRDL
ncbi:histamine H2 receptor-like [Montipora foliosa]|uniref:histamine H2 receptor-like n=1 Tax=Montipora foliosa TaxID=591990 RepID=UPI0035F1A68A